MKVSPTRAVARGLQRIEFAPQKYLPISRKADGFDWQFAYYSSLYRSEHETSIRKLALEKGGDCFFDIGANIGGWSLRATRYFQQVFAFEPHPWTAAILRRNFDKNRSHYEKACSVHLYACALGSRNGSLTFYSGRRGDRGNGGASLTVMNPGHPHPGRRRNSVEVRRFDDLALPVTRRSLVKIDTEGGEVPVLQGMRQTLSESHPRLLVEAHGGENVRICKKILEDHSYSIYEMRLPGQSYFLAQ